MSVWPSVIRPNCPRHWPFVRLHILVSSLCTQVFLGIVSTAAEILSVEIREVYTEAAAIAVP